MKLYRNKKGAFVILIVGLIIVIGGITFLFVGDKTVGKGKGIHSVVYPKAGSVFYIGETMKIEWECNDVPEVSIYADDGKGRSYLNPIKLNIPANCPKSSLDWTVDIPSGEYRIEVNARGPLSNPQY